MMLSIPGLTQAGEFLTDINWRGSWEMECIAEKIARRASGKNRGRVDSENKLYNFASNFEEMYRSLH